MAQRTIRYELVDSALIGDARRQPFTVVAELTIIDPKCTPEWFADAIRFGIITESTTKPERDRSTQAHDRQIAE